MAASALITLPSCVPLPSHPPRPARGMGGGVLAGLDSKKRTGENEGFAADAVARGPVIREAMSVYPPVPWTEKKIAKRKNTKGKTKRRACCRCCRGPWCKGSKVGDGERQSVLYSILSAAVSVVCVCGWCPFCGRPALRIASLGANPHSDNPVEFAPPIGCSSVPAASDGPLHSPP